MTQLSIVFQGPVFPSLQDNLRRTRRVYPEAEIIVSTWHASAEEDARLRDWLAVSGIRLVLSDDPGPLTGRDASGEWSTNINRMLLSSRAGLAAATHPLAVKLRTDSWLSDRTLSVLLEQVLSDEQMPARDPDYRVFHSRVMTATWFARDARGSLPLLFHPGDIMLAGRTEDVALFFNAPPAGASLFRPAIAAGLWSAWQYVPEQWLWVNAIHQATNRDVFAGNFHHTPGLWRALNAISWQTLFPTVPVSWGCTGQNTGAVIRYAGYSVSIHTPAGAVWMPGYRGAPFVLPGPWPADC